MLSKLQGAVDCGGAGVVEVVIGDKKRIWRKEELKEQRVNVINIACDIDSQLGRNGLICLADSYGCPPVTKPPWHAVLLS